MKTQIMKTTDTSKMLFKNNFSTPFNRQYGLTIIEIMVAVTISLLLLAGVIQIVFANKQTYRVQDAMARVQENGRFSLQFLNSDIRMAGFMGCKGMNGGLEVNNNVDASKFSDPANAADVAATLEGFNGNDAIRGYSYDGTLTAELSALGLTSGTSFGDLVPNTDVLHLTRAVSCPGGNVTSHNNNSAQLFIEDNSICNIQQNDIVMVSNCQTADIFGVTNVVNSNGNGNDNIAHGTNLNLGPKLANGYGPGSFIYRMKSYVYYIGYGDSGQPALFKRDLVLGALVNFELVEGIEDMTVLYGEDRNQDGTADIYVDVTDVNNMDDVVSLRLTTTARTLENGIATQVNNGDKRIRRGFTTTIAIRNRVG